VSVDTGTRSAWNKGKIVMGNDIVMEIDITYVELNQVIHVEKRESVE